MTNVTDLTVTSTLASTDIIYTVVDPSGTPLDRKATVQTVSNKVNQLGTVFLCNEVKTITNSSAETTMLGTIGVGSYTNAANAFAVFSTQHVSAKGTLATIGSPGNITLKAKFGSTVLVSSGAVALVASQVDVGWNLELDISCVSIGGSGTFFVEGYFIYGDGNGKRIPLANLNTVIASTIVSQAFSLTAQFSVADPGNTLNTMILYGRKVY